MKVFVFQDHIKICFCFIIFLTYKKSAIVDFFFPNGDIFVEFANTEIKVKADTLGSKLWKI